MEPLIATPHRQPLSASAACMRRGMGKGSGTMEQNEVAHHQAPAEAPIVEIDPKTVWIQEGKPTGSTIPAPDAVLDDDGRTYHGYDQGQYFLPNDGEEQDRLDLQHAMSTLLLGGTYGLAPFDEPPAKVMDLATGTGIWALEYARQHPTAHVVGTDLSLIQPVPDVPNCEFIRENSETEKWILPYCFDYIHLRYTLSCFNDTMTILHKAWDQLNPGGWIELFDPVNEGVFSQDNTCPGSAIERWAFVVTQGAKRLGRDVSKAIHYRDWLSREGFTQVTERVLPLPCSPWAKDPHFKQLGIFARHDCLNLVKGVRKFLLAADLPAREADELIEKAQEELRHDQVHAIWPVYVVYARKPLESEMTPEQLKRWKEKEEQIAYEAAKRESPKTT